MRFCPKLAADWLRALERKPNHALSLLALAEYELEWFDLTAAEHYATRALAALTLYNATRKAAWSITFWAAFLRNKKL